MKTEPRPVLSNGIKETNIITKVREDGLTGKWFERREVRDRKHAREWKRDCVPCVAGTKN